MKAAKVNHTKGLEAAMGMSFHKLNKLRAEWTALKKARETATPRFAEVKALVDAAHAAMQQYREEHNIDAFGKPRIPGVKYA